MFRSVLLGSISSFAGETTSWQYLQFGLFMLISMFTTGRGNYKLDYNIKVEQRVLKNMNPINDLPSLEYELDHMPSLVIWPAIVHHNTKIVKGLLYYLRKEDVRQKNTMETPMLSRRNPQDDQGAPSKQDFSTQITQEYNLFVVVRQSDHAPYVHALKRALQLDTNITWFLSPSIGTTDAPSPRPRLILYFIFCPTPRVDIGPKCMEYCKLHADNVIVVLVRKGRNAQQVDKHSLMNSDKNVIYLELYFEPSGPCQILQNHDISKQTIDIIKTFIIKNSSLSPNVRSLPQHEATHKKQISKSVNTIPVIVTQGYYINYVDTFGNITNLQFQYFITPSYENTPINESTTTPARRLPILFYVIFCSTPRFDTSVYSHINYYKQQVDFVIVLAIRKGIDAQPLDKSNFHGVYVYELFYEPGNFSIINNEHNNQTISEIQALVRSKNT